MRCGLKYCGKERKALLEEIEKMHARPEIREILIAGKLKRWALIGQHPHAYPNCSSARARRNFSRLFSRYPQIAKRLGMTRSRRTPLFNERRTFKNHETTPVLLL